MADAFGLGFAFVVTELLTGPLSAPGSADRLAPGEELALFGLTLPVWAVLAKIYGLYDGDEEQPAHTTLDDFFGVFHLVTVGVWAIAAGGWLTGLVRPELTKLALFWVIAITLTVLARSISRALARRTLAYRQKAVIIGADHVARLIADKLRQRPESGIEVVGHVAEPGDGPGLGDGLKLLGQPSELPSIASQLEIERVLIASLDERDGPPIIRALRALDVQIDFVPRPFEATGPNGSVHMLDGVPILGLSPIRLSRSSLALKRGMDIVLSALGLTIMAPVLALIALKIKLDSPGPVLYRHDRIGKDARPFRLLKFRTMHAKYCRGTDYGGEVAEQEFERLMKDPSARTEFESNYKLRDDPRVTRFGAFLRRTSLDELPQLVNVLRGELSLVGPRPVVAEELERYGNEADTLLSLRPGVTGYWQINGRSDSSYAERIRLDIAYASNWSVRLDLGILAHTLRALTMSPQGAY
jgi:exopolysaccharide biosynthesis polyprenyl glycosylphosphotransferase